MIAPQMEPWTWMNSVGTPWPAKDEFEVGCTYEHAGYFLSWLLTFFGPARRVTSFASCQIPDKGIEVNEMAPDFTCGCIEFGNGVVARAVSRLVTIASGLDPHGLGVPEVYWLRRAEEYRTSATAFASGSREGVRDWLVFCCRALEDGAREALSIAEALQK